MEIACVIHGRLATLARSGRSGGPRPGRADLPSGEADAGLPDPVAAAEASEAMVRALEAIGAAVESERPGEAFFAVDGLRGIHGGDRAGVLAAAQKAAARALGETPRIATGPPRFTAFVAAGDWSRPVPISTLRTRLGVSDRGAGLALRCRPAEPHAPPASSRRRAARRRPAGHSFGRRGR